MTRHLLITGGAGFIGANFCHHWATHHPADPILVLDALTYAGNPANLAPLADHPNYQFIQEANSPPIASSISLPISAGLVGAAVGQAMKF
jgi:dTDP-D-glucose 4,6-dehydratase